jgi:elongation factor P--(R)-beta-lysine ligase
LSLPHLAHRAALYNAIRAFFAAKQVLEVETPILASAAVPEPSIEPLKTILFNRKIMYLQTSPELAMKRLLVEGSGAIFQICKVFRDEELGSLHTPEFSMLEWYRPGYDHNQLIAEVDELLQYLLACPAAQQLSYIEAFKIYLDLHPLETDLAILQHKVQQYAPNAALYDRDTCLQLLMTHIIEPQLIGATPWVITEFPASQAALARKINSDVAARFEFYMQGMELANGFYELNDVNEQRQRFMQDLQQRQLNHQELLPIDEEFLAALQRGLPDCAGVAVGIDRLLMLQLGAQHIDEVLSIKVNFE